MKFIGKRLRQYIVLMSFFLVDVISTAIHIENPMQESMPVARFFMLLVNNIYLGLLIHFLFISILIYNVIIHLPRIFPLSEDVFHFIFVMLSALDFGVGATSWFWKAPLNIRIIVGGLLYVIIDHFWIKQIEH